MITEEQKQEADRIVNKYNMIIIMQYDSDCINAAIQDRQSVLDVLKKVADTTIVDKAVNNEIQSITSQITYLKSKI